MLTNIVKATKAHYAALQHRKSPDRTRLNYSVETKNGTLLTSGAIWVKVQSVGRRQAELTKLSNRLQAMFPEGHSFNCEYSEEK